MQSLEAYRISPFTGWLLSHPTTPPQTLLPFYELLKKSHDLLEAGKIREAIEKLPTLDMSQVKTYEEKCLTHKVLAFLASHYVWQDGVDKPAEILPAVIAKPLMKVSLQLGCQPIRSLVDIIYSNCFPEKRHHLQPQTFFVEFLPNEDLNYKKFIELSSDVELTFSEGAKIIMYTISAMDRNDVKVAIECLTMLANVISVMREKLILILDEVDPEVFVRKIRPLMSGWPKGLIYEGVPDDVVAGAELDIPGSVTPRKRIFTDMSGGQTVSMESIDAFLGIEHFPDIKEVHWAYQKYMIREHRKFIEDLREHVHLRDFVENSGSEELKRAYNSCIEEVLHFKRDHLRIVQKFIIDATRKEPLPRDGLSIRSFFERIMAKTGIALFQLKATS